MPRHGATSKAGNHQLASWPPTQSCAACLARQAGLTREPGKIGKVLLVETLCAWHMTSWLFSELSTLRMDATQRCWLQLTIFKMPKKLSNLNWSLTGPLPVSMMIIIDSLACFWFMFLLLPLPLCLASSTMWTETGLLVTRVDASQVPRPSCVVSWGTWLSGCQVGRWQPLSGSWVDTRVHVRWVAG